MNAPHSQRAHAKLSASGAHRWMVCPASVRMEEGYADESSSYAREGTAAHELADRCLRHERSARSYVGTEIEVEGVTYSVDVEMADYVQQYLDYVRLLPGFHFPEQRVDFSQWVPDGFGTSDSIVIADGVISIVDLKYGKGVAVSAENNPQLMLYALGALAAYDFLYDLHTVRMTIVQPRLDHISEWEIPVTGLLAFGERAREAAAVALSGEGGFVPEDKACRFCKARGECKAQAAQHLQTVKGEFAGFEEALAAPLIDTDRLDARELAALLAQVDAITAWASAIEASAQAILEAGGELPGYKLVEGRSNRQWADDVEAEAALRAAKVKVADMMATKLKTPTQMEKVLGKEHPVLLAHVIKPKGKPTIAPLSDKRPALDIKPVADDFAGL